MPMTLYLRNKLGDHSIGKAAFTMPTTAYLALFTASPTDSGSLTNEVTGGSYARQAITSSMSAFSASVSSSTADVTFPAPTANWGTITYVGVIDALTVGNMLYYEALPAPRNVLSGSRRVLFAIGQLQIRVL